MGGGSGSVSWAGRGLGVVQGLVLSRTYCTFTVPLATVWCINISDFKFKISWIIDELFFFIKRYKDFGPEILESFSITFHSYFIWLKDAHRYFQKFKCFMYEIGTYTYSSYSRDTLSTNNICFISVDFFYLKMLYNRIIYFLHKMV